MLTQLDLCSGVGAGFALAGLQLGLELVGLAETDEYCSDILLKRYPGVHNYKDVRSIRVPFSRKISILTGSPPCQPFSVQGNRLGATDERDCFPAVVEAIKWFNPQFFAIENVAGLLTCPWRPGYGRGTYFHYLLRDLSACGYDAEWLVVSSGSFGAPWIRQRLLLVGISRSLELPWKQSTPWIEQIRGTVKENRSTRTGGSPQPGISRAELFTGHWVDRSTGRTKRFGIPSKDGTVRDRRAALGNALDPRVAAVALRRVLYLNSLVGPEIAKLTSAAK